MKENIQEKEPGVSSLANKGTSCNAEAEGPGYSCSVGFDHYNGMVTNVTKWTGLLQ